MRPGGRVTEGRRCRLGRRVAAAGFGRHRRRGSARPLDPSRPCRVPAAQTAYGLIVDEDVASPFLVPGEALFMDWRPDHGETGLPPPLSRRRQRGRC